MGSSIVAHTGGVTLSAKANQIAGAQQIEEAKDSVRRSAVAFTDAMYASVEISHWNIQSV